ncbi:NAD-dependent epimerase/dehydratase family protein [Antarctobacter sp.]|uniref:NAD-dependent epimerase/dehydratase family protein n=1 Tax=Antarctobacter sp. TaxID=1872577 RepID=UPI003A8D76AD
MTRALWRAEGFFLIPVVRSGSAEQGELIWSPGDKTPEIGPVAAIVALWGVTPGPGRNLADNARLALSAMDLGAALGAGAVVHCSSAAVYRPSAEPIKETDLPAPASPYGQAKLEMEQAIAAHRKPGGPRQIVLRIGNVAGADSLFGNLQMNGHITLDRFSDGLGPSRSYIAPGDLVRVIEALVQSPEADGTYNVSAARPTAMAEIAGVCQTAVTWRAAPEAAAQMVWLDTVRLGRVVTLAPNAHEAAHLVEGARDSGVWP